jgi:hypothetical protein
MFFEKYRASVQAHSLEKSTARIVSLFSITAILFQYIESVRLFKSCSIQVGKEDVGKKNHQSLLSFRSGHHGRHVTPRRERAISNFLEATTIPAKNDCSLKLPYQQDAAMY